MLTLVTGTDTGRVQDQIRQIREQFLADTPAAQALQTRYDANLNTETQILTANTLNSLFHTHHIVIISNIDKLKDKTFQLFKTNNTNTLTILTSDKNSALLKNVAKRNNWQHYNYDTPVNVNAARIRNMEANETRNYHLDKTVISRVTQLCVDDTLATDSVMYALSILQKSDIELNEHLITNMCAAASPTVKSKYGKTVVAALLDGSLNPDQYMSTNVNMPTGEQVETFKWVLRRRSDKKTPALVAGCAIASKIVHTAG